MYVSAIAYKSKLTTDGRILSDDKGDALIFKEKNIEF